MKRFAKLAIAMFLTTNINVMAATPVNPTRNVNADERAKIEEVVHQYLLREPQVLVEAMQILQRKQYEEAEQTIKRTQKSAGDYVELLFRQNNDPVGGNPKGKVTVTEFFDYQCPHCVEMDPVMKAIESSNADVRIVYKEFPIRGDMSVFASRAALAANKQGKYNEFSHLLLKAPQPLTQEIIFKTASDAGLDVARLKKDMNDRSIDDQLKANRDLANSLKLFGTPALFIGKTDAKKGTNIIYVPGRMEKAQLQGAIDSMAK